jgi:Helix-turn-helix domain
MSVRKLKRAAVLGRVKAGELRLGQAAELMGVSYRQGRRLWRRFRTRGARGLRHASVGRRSNRRAAAPGGNSAAMRRTSGSGRPQPRLAGVFTQAHPSPVLPWVRQPAHKRGHRVAAPSVCSIAVSRSSPPCPSCGERNSPAQALPDNPPRQRRR